MTQVKYDELLSLYRQWNIEAVRVRARIAALDGFRPADAAMNRRVAELGSYQRRLKRLKAILDQREKQTKETA